jgi:EAL domain-containing protein (putative c-di-GMP-specific phosphodiesterase class I)
MKNDDGLKVVNFKKKINNIFHGKDLRDYYVLFIEVSNLNTYSLFYDITLSEKLSSLIYSDLQRMFSKKFVFLYKSDQIIVINEFANKVVLDRGVRADEQRHACQEIINFISHQKYSPKGYEQYYNVELTIGSGSMGLIHKEKDIDALIRLAHFSMIKAKEKSRKILVADEAIRTVKMDLDDFNMEIEKGFKLDEFSPFFIPIISPDTMEVIGCESLVRWRKDKYRVIEASKFKGIAIERNLFEKIDQRVIEKTFQAYLKWRNLRLINENFVLSINLSKQSLLDLNSIDLIKNLSEYRLNPNNVEFDIDIEQAISQIEIDAINSLKHQGFKIALDVINLQSISLDLLSSIAIDTIKFSRLHIYDDNSYSEREYNLYRSIIRIAKVMNINIMAKGIETHQHLKMSKNLKVGYIQGFYFTKPLDEYNFGIFLNKYKDGINTFE